MLLVSVLGISGISLSLPSFLLALNFRPWNQMIIPCWLFPYVPNWTMTCLKCFCGSPLLTELNSPARNKRLVLCHLSLIPCHSQLYTFPAACQFTWNHTGSCFHSFADAVLPKMPSPSFFAYSFTNLTLLRCYSFNKH